MCLRNIFDYTLDFLRRLHYWYSSVNITKLLQQPSVRKAELLSPLIGECLSVFPLWYVRRGVSSDITI